jgi:hypothetical protein
MGKRIVLICAFILIVSGSCFAQTTVKAELDKSRISVDETVTYKVTIVFSDKQIPTPVFPDFKRFAVLSSTQSSTISFSGQKIQTMLVFVFVLMPDGPGTLQIPSTAITIGSNRFATDSFVLQVTPGSGKFRRPQRPPESAPKQRPPNIGDEPQYDI